MRFSLLFTTIFLILAVNFELNYFTLTLRSLVLPLVALLYYVHSLHKKRLYLIAMLFASLSNLMFIFSTYHLILIGLLAFLMYRIIILFQVFQLSEKIYLIPFLLGFSLLLIPIAYLFYITSDSLGILFYIGLISIFLNAFVGGISISNYTSLNSISNTSLLVSSLFFVFLAVIFIIQKFFIHIPIIEPLRVVVLVSAHYFYYLFLIQKENEKK